MEIMVTFKESLRALNCTYIIIIVNVIDLKQKKRIISDTPLCSVGLKSGIPNIIKINTAKYTAAE